MSGGKGQLGRPVGHHPGADPPLSVAVFAELSAPYRAKLFGEDRVGRTASARHPPGCRHQLIAGREA